MNKTIFQSHGTQSKPASPLYPVLMFGAAALVIVMLITSDGHVRYVGIGPLLLAVVLQKQHNKRSNIRVFVNQSGTDFEFGYYNDSNQLIGPYPIDEYTYWYYQQAPVQSGWKYILYFQINTGGRTVYLKEEVVGANPPSGWTKSTQRFSEGAVAVYECGNLVTLAKLIDAGSTEETNATENQ